MKDDTPKSLCDFENNLLNGLRHLGQDVGTVKFPSLAQVKLKLVL